MKTTEEKLDLAQQLAGLSKAERAEVDLYIERFPAPAKKGPKPGPKKKAAKKAVKKRRKRRTREQIEADEQAAREALSAEEQAAHDALTEGL